MMAARSGHTFVSACKSMSCPNQRLRRGAESFSIGDQVRPEVILSNAKGLLLYRIHDHDSRHGCCGSGEQRSVLRRVLQHCQHWNMSDRKKMLLLQRLAGVNRVERRSVSCSFLSQQHVHWSQTRTFVLSDDTDKCGICSRTLPW